MYKLIKKRILFLRICDYISLSCSITIVYLYIHFNKPWFLSDLLSVFIMGSMIKLFKFRSLRDSIMFLTPNIILNICAVIYLSIYVR